MNNPDYEIDITIEAITGTVYDLCVSPFETILGIKTKIQRLEGIPVYQQHLIYGDTELLDDYCLDEYDIRTGCQLRLVIALRGGPVHAHRVQLEDSALMELAEFLETQSGMESEQYMLMLLNEDGNIELVNASDSRSQLLQSPIELSESRQSGSETSLLTAPPPPRVLTLTENMNTRDKMREVQSKLENLRLNRAEHQLPKEPMKLKRKHTAKVIILDSRTSSRIPVSPSPATPPQPSSRVCPHPPHYWGACHCQHHCRRCHDASARSQRKLIFKPPSTGLSGRGNTRDVHQLTTPQAAPLHYNPNRHRNLKPLSSNIQDSSFMLPSLRSENNMISSDRLLPAAVTGSRHNTSVGPNGPFLPPIINKRSVVSDTTSSDFLKQKSNMKNRCMQCGKRTRIAATFNCRCGGHYCAKHRYAERHACTFDYKAEGKETIGRNNPLVVANKLPKI